MKIKYTDVLVVIAFICFLTLTIRNNTKIHYLEAKLNDVRHESLQQDSASIQNSIYILDEIIDINNNIMNSELNTNKKFEDRFNKLNKKINYLDMMTIENAETNFIQYKLYWSQHDSVSIENAMQRY